MLCKNNKNVEAVYLSASSAFPIQAVEHYVVLLNMFAFSVHPTPVFLFVFICSVTVFCRGGLISSLIGEKSVTQRWEVCFAFW